MGFCLSGYSDRIMKDDGRSIINSHITYSILNAVKICESLNYTVFALWHAT